MTVHLRINRAGARRRAAAARRAARITVVAHGRDGRARVATRAVKIVR